MELELENIKSLDGLPDCAKLKLSEIDPISRTSKCDNNKQEIFHVDEEVSFSYLDEEEEEMELDLTEDVTDDEDRAGKAVYEIECLIRQIELMQMAIRSRQVGKSSEKVSEESVEPPMEQLTKAQTKCKKFESQEKEPQAKEKSKTKEPKIQPLTDQELLEARSLRQAHHRLQQEIDELICRYRKLREIIHQLRGNITCMENNLKNISSKTEEHLAWAQEFSKEMHVCKERYIYLIHAKMSKREAIKTENVHAVRFARFYKAYLKKSRLKCEILEFCEEVNDLVVLMTELHQELERNMSLFETQRISKPNPAEFLMSIEAASKSNNKFLESVMKLEDAENNKK
ncbi:cingulin [Drosophila takahashii]|uniref:cingulin n=1 Tax=Drosophila takahashii TaxID=29030 RepID=UPI003898FE25